MLNLKRFDLSKALSGPTGWIFAAGSVYIGYVVVKFALGLVEDALQRAKDLAQGFNPNPSHNPADQPSGPPPATHFLTAKILEPANNGHAPRGFFDRKYKIVVQLGNPGDRVVAQVTVKVTEKSQLLRYNNVASSGRQITLEKASTTVHEFWFFGGLFDTFDGVAEVSIDGKWMATPVVFSIY